MVGATTGALSRRDGISDDRVLSVNETYNPEWLLEEVPLPGIRGRLESELGREGGGCWGRVDADAKNARIVREVEELGAGTEGEEQGQ